ncbi:MAG: GNAT family N-acetyltransferase [Anaerolineae bacterium]|nr:GNAT family N-acetyltransferase [Anaerolineae bacterium]
MDSDPSIKDTLSPGMPAVPGLIFRPIRGEPDADALHAVHAGRLVRDAVDPMSTYEDCPSRASLATDLAQACTDGRQDDWLVAEVDGEVVGYSQIDAWPEADGTWVYLILGWVLPAWRGRGISTAMLHRVEERVRRLAKAQHPGVPFEFAANATSTETEAMALLAHEGYRAGYTVLEMEIDPSAPVPAMPLPPGVEVRPALPEHYLPISISIDEAYRQEYEAGRYQEDFDPEAYADRLRAPRHDPSLWQVAWAGDQVAGQVLSAIEENGVAEVFEVSVRPAWRRRGLGRALLSRALIELRARGVETIRLRTVAEFRTRASDLYRSVGFRLLKEFPRYRKPAG